MLLNLFVFLLLTVFYYRELGWGGSISAKNLERRENYFSSSLLASVKQLFCHPPPSLPPRTPGPGAKPFPIHFLGPASSHPHPSLARLSCPDTQNLSGHSSGSEKKGWRHGRG